MSWHSPLRSQNCWGETAVDLVEVATAVEIGVRRPQAIEELAANSAGDGSGFRLMLPRKWRIVAKSFLSTLSFAAKEAAATIYPASPCSSVKKCWCTCANVFDRHVDEPLFSASKAEVPCLSGHLTKGRLRGRVAMPREGDGCRQCQTLPLRLRAVPLRGAGGLELRTKLV